MDLEELAVFWAVKKLKRYFRGIPFMIVIDHSTLKYIFTKDEILEGRRRQWMIYLQQFDFKIEHKVGKKMLHMDYLSRLPIKHEMLYELKKTIKETFIS